MTEEELGIRKELFERELDRLKSLSSDFEYLLDTEKLSFFQDLYYEYLLTCDEFERLSLENDFEHRDKLLEILSDYMNSLKELSNSKDHDVTKKIENI